MDGAAATYPNVAGASSALKLREDGPRGRGLFSTRAGAPGEVMLSIPLQYALLVRGDLNTDKEVCHRPPLYMCGRIDVAAGGLHLEVEVRVMDSHPWTPKSIRYSKGRVPRVR